MKYITKEFLIQRIKETTKTINTFDSSELYSLAQLYKGKLTCLIELLIEIDPDYTLDELTSTHIAKIFN